MDDIAREATPRNCLYRYAPVESAFIADYASGMATDIAELLGRALREIRKRTTGTQDEWAARTGMAQSYLSAVERGKSGWESLRTIADAVVAAGADPVDLLRLAAAENDEDRELLALWVTAPKVQREAILTLLRGLPATSRAAAR